jgi:hypothetical protein
LDVNLKKNKPLADVNGAFNLMIFYRKAPHVGTKFTKGMSYSEWVRGSFVNIAAPFAASVVKKMAAMP